MEFLKQWTFCVCASLLIAVIFSLFTPKGSMKRFYTVLISLFVFLSFLYPFHNFSASEFLKMNENKVWTQETDGTAVYREMAEEKIQTALKKHGIVGASVDVSLSLDYQSGALEINEVTVAIGDEYDRAETEKILFDKVGIHTKVIGIGE